MIQTRIFAAGESSPMDARHFVLGLIEDMSSEIRNSVEVMVSELATNAQLHAATDFEVQVSSSDTDGRLRVSVTDRGPGRPALQQPSVTQPHGRGLQIVAMLSDSWGVDWEPDAQGKTVWFELVAARATPNPVVTSTGERRGTYSPGLLASGEPVPPRIDDPRPGRDDSFRLAGCRRRPARVRPCDSSSRATCPDYQPSA